VVLDDDNKSNKYTSHFVTILRASNEYCLLIQSKAGPPPQPIRIHTGCWCSIPTSESPMTCYTAISGFVLHGVDVRGLEFRAFYAGTKWKCSWTSLRIKTFVGDRYRWQPSIPESHESGSRIFSVSWDVGSWRRLHSRIGGTCQKCQRRWKKAGRGLDNSLLVTNLIEGQLPSWVHRLYSFASLNVQKFVACSGGAERQSTLGPAHVLKNVSRSKFGICDA